MELYVAYQYPEYNQMIITLLTILGFILSVYVYKRSFIIPYLETIAELFMAMHLSLFIANLFI